MRLTKDFPNGTNVKSIAWEADTLYVTFVRNDATYLYENVPEHMFHEMCNAASAGSYFHAAIRPAFRGVPVPRENLTA